MTDRDRLRATFDSAAELYQHARPDYPDELYDALVSATDSHEGTRALEIGCATGKATIPLARRGFQVTAVEPGASMVEVAQRNLAEFPNAQVIRGDFESVDLSAFEPFDLVLAATSWHWLDPRVRFARARRALRSGGHLAFWSATHVFPEDGDPIFVDLQPTYDAIGEGLPPDAAWPKPGELPDQRDDIGASGSFETVLVQEFDWEVSYDARSYVRLLDTFSDHIAMQPWQRERLYSEIHRLLGQRPDGRLRRGWGAVLHVARAR